MYQMYSYREDIEQFLQERSAFEKFKFEKEAFGNVAFADRGAVHQDELPLLQELIERSNGHHGPIVEIGTLFGFTTQKIALWKDAAKKIIAVDIFGWNPVGFSPEVHYEFTSRILWYFIQSGQVELVRMDKDVFFKNYQGEAPSLVFIDADHRYEGTISDIKEAQRIGTQIICGHDYIALHPGVIQAVDECGGPSKLCGSLWVL